MATGLNYPPLPEGFVLDEKTPTNIPELPEGFVLDQPPSRTEKPSKGVLGEIGRHAARTGSRIGESVLGLPSDILQVAQVGAGGLEKGAGKIREKIGLKPLETKERPPGVPGSEELKEISTKLFGEKVTAQSPTESFIDDIVSDASVLAIPVKGKIPFMRSIGTALAGNIGAKGAEQLGFGKTGQTAAKIGAFFLSGLAGKGNVKKYWKQQYKLAEDAIPSGDKVHTFTLDRKMDELTGELEKGISTPSKKFVRAPMKNIRKKIETGSVDVEELVQMKKDINELRGKLYKDLTGKKSIGYAQGKINDLSGLIDQEITKYGKNNPEFLKHYRNANEAYAGFNQSKRVGNWVKRILPLGKMGKGALLLAEAIFKPATLPYTLGGFGALKGSELLTRMFKNPTLRRYYANLVKDGIKENRAGFLKNIKSMEKELKKSDPDIFDELRRKQDTK